MSNTPRNAVIASLVVAVLAGYFIVGHYLYKVPIGLDQSGFLAGDAMHSIAALFAPEAKNAMSGAVLLFLAAIAAGPGGFVLVRSAMRKPQASVDPSRSSASALSRRARRESPRRDHDGKQPEREQERDLGWNHCNGGYRVSAGSSRRRRRERETDCFTASTDLDIAAS